MEMAYAWGNADAETSGWGMDQDSGGTGEAFGGGGGGDTFAAFASAAAASTAADSDLMVTDAAALGESEFDNGNTWGVPNPTDGGAESFESGLNLRRDWTERDGAQDLLFLPPVSTDAEPFQDAEMGLHGKAVRIGKGQEFWIGAGDDVFSLRPDDKGMAPCTDRGERCHLLYNTVGVNAWLAANGQSFTPFDFFQRFSYLGVATNVASTSQAGIQRVTIQTMGDVRRVPLHKADGPRLPHAPVGFKLDYVRLPPAYFLHDGHRPKMTVGGEGPYRMMAGPRGTASGAGAPGFEIHNTGGAHNSVCLQVLPYIFPDAADTLPGAAAIITGFYYDLPSIVSSMRRAADDCWFRDTGIMLQSDFGHFKDPLRLFHLNLVPE